MREEAITKLSKTHWTQGFTCLPNKLGDDVESHGAFRMLYKLMTMYYLDDPKVDILEASEIANMPLPDTEDALRELENLGYLKKDHEVVYHLVRYYNIRPTFGR